MDHFRRVCMHECVRLLTIFGKCDWTQFVHILYRNSGGKSNKAFFKLFFHRDMTSSTVFSNFNEPRAKRTLTLASASGRKRFFQ